MYPNPEAFDPERFIKEGQLDMDGRDPANYMFGFGRRYGCPRTLSRLGNAETCSMSPQDLSRPEFCGGIAVHSLRIRAQHV